MAVSALAQAHDLGVQGRLYSIGEIDMRVLMARSMSHVDETKIQQQMLASTKNFTKHLPQYPLPPVRVTATRYVDPSAVLNRDITGMKQNAQGNWVWAVLWKKGTKVNPLDHVRPKTGLLYFNGLSKPQLDFAKAIYAEHPARIRLVETQGDPAVLSRLLNVPVYMAQKESLDRFQVTQTPTLVVPGTAAHAKELRVTVFGTPYVAQQADVAAILRATWQSSGVNASTATAAIKAYGPRQEKTKP